VTAPRHPHEVFNMVRAVGARLPDVREVVKAGAPVLKLRGSFMAGLAVHPSAEPGTLVLRYPLEQRDVLIEDAPDTYYITDYYERHPLVLARLSRIDEAALRDLLSVSWRLTAEKVGRAGARARPRRGG
jgi:hypothetical protein